MRADVEKYVELRKRGLTHKEIGEVEGAHEAKVRCAINNYATRFRGITPARCIYAGLRKWLNENECTVAELAQRIYGEAYTKVTRNRYYKLLRGDHCMTMADIDDMISVTGLTYEELFGLKGATT